MANIVDETFFYGSLSVAQASSPTVVSQLTIYIDELEPKLLELLFGVELKELYDAGIAGDEQKYKDIRDGKVYVDPSGKKINWKGLRYSNGLSKKSLIANYIYYYYYRNLVTNSSRSGEKKDKKENSEPWTPDFKLASAWNEMVQMNVDLRKFLLDNPNDYPEYDDPIKRSSSSLKPFERETLNKRQELFAIVNPLF